jgi:hypothetical protein
MDNGQVEILESPAQRMVGWQSYRLGWPAYVRPCVAAFIRVFLLSVLPAVLLTTVFKKPMWVTPAVVAGAVLNIAFFAYDILSLHRVVLYTDEHGVWLASGLLPWNSGVSGVKWRDVSEAVFVQGLASWAFRSYTVRVGHKFTNDTELRVANVWKGHEAVQHVNDVLMRPQLYFSR